MKYLGESMKQSEISSVSPFGEGVAESASEVNQAAKG
jgi:hypothetical protein